MNEEHFKAKRLIDTNKLVRLVYRLISNKNTNQLTPEQLYGLSKLTWITKGKNPDTYMTGAKIPALTNCFQLQKIPQKGKEPSKKLENFVNTNFETLNKNEKFLLLRHSGFSNIRSPYRNSSLKWIEENKNIINDLFKAAYQLNKNDSYRFQIFSKIKSLNGIPTGMGNGGQLNPAYFLSPIIFALDPKIRCPILNGSPENEKFRKILCSISSTLEDQVTNLISQIDLKHIKNAAELDCHIQSGKPPLIGKTIDGNSLRNMNDEDLSFFINGGTQSAKRKHNELTNKMVDLFEPSRLLCGNRRECRFDILIPSQNSNKQHLLIEVKSSNSVPDIRLAVGQLLHYKHHLYDPYKSADMAILVPDKPNKSIIQFLSRNNIFSMWFDEYGVLKIAGPNLKSQNYIESKRYN